MVDYRPMATGAGVMGAVPRSQSALPIGIIVSRLGRSQLGFHAQIAETTNRGDVIGERPSMQSRNYCTNGPGRGP